MAIEWKAVSSKGCMTNSLLPFGMKGLAELNVEVSFMGFMAKGSKAEGSQSACKGTGLLKKD